MQTTNLNLDQLAHIITESTSTEIISDHYAGMLTTKIIHPEYKTAFLIQGDNGAVLVTE